MNRESLRVASIVLNNFTNDSRVLKEARSLQKNNYDVTIIALHEGLLKEHETIENFKVHRIKLISRSWSKNKFIQLLKYGEFVFRIVKKYRKKDIFHCHDLNTLPIGAIVKLFLNKKAKIVYDAHEYETERNGLKGIEKFLVAKIEKLLIRYADKVITVSDSIANEYVQLYGIKKPALVLNTPPYKTIAKNNIFRDTLGIRKEQIIFLYQGGLSKGRGVDILLEAFQSMKDDKKIIIFMGYGDLEKLVIAASKQYPNIYFHKAVAPDILLKYTSSADFGVCAIENSCLSYKYCLPNKMFEYLMAEIPIIVSNLYEMKKIVKLNKIGVVAQANTSDKLIKAMDKIMKLDQKELLENIQKIKKDYNWEQQEKALLNIYRKIV